MPSAKSRIQLGAGLAQQLLPMRKHQHLSASDPGEFRKDHRLPCTRGEADYHAPDTPAARCQNSGDGIALVGPKTHWAFWHLIASRLCGGPHGRKVTRLICGGEPDLQIALFWQYRRDSES
jgi:hypothetical protein